MVMSVDFQLKHHRRLADEFENWKSYLQELYYYCLPRKAYINRQRNPGDRLPTDLYNSIGITSAQYLSAGMQGYLTNPQSRWFALSLKKRALLQLAGVKDWLRDCEDEIYSTLNGSNFNDCIPESYLDLAIAGTHILYQEEDIKTKVRFYPMPIENCLFCEDAYGRVNTLYITWEFTSDQAVEKFGDSKVPEKVKKAFVEGDYSTKFLFLLCVYPRSYYDSSKRDKLNMPYAADWIYVEDKQKIIESGYREFPFNAPRWTKAGREKMGYSAAMNILPDLKMLNSMDETNIIGGQMKVAPPLEVPDEAFIRPYDFNPFGINIKNTGFADEHITPIITGADVPLGEDMVARRELKVERAFFVDLFVTMRDKDMTAYEVSQVVAERMLLLGPSLGRLMSELLDPIISRTFSILYRNGLLPEPPDAIRGQELDIQYISILARAQKAVELQSLTQAIGMISQFAMADQKVLDKIDFDKAVDIVGEITGINQKIIRDDAEVEDIRAQRQEENAMAMKLTALQQGADIVKKGSEADKNLAAAQAPEGAGK